MRGMMPTPSDAIAELEEKDERLQCAERHLMIGKKHADKAELCMQKIDELAAQADSYIRKSNLRFSFASCVLAANSAPAEARALQADPDAEAIAQRPRRRSRSAARTRRSRSTAPSPERMSAQSPNPERNRRSRSPAQSPERVDYAANID